MPITLLAGLFQLLMIGPYLENLYHQPSQCGNVANFPITQILREINLANVSHKKIPLIPVIGGEFAVLDFT